VSQRCALTQNSFKTLCPGCSNVIVSKIEVHQRWVLHQHSCKPLCMLFSDSTGMIVFIVFIVIIIKELECGDSIQGCQRSKLPESELYLPIEFALQEGHAPADNFVAGGCTLSTKSLTLFEVILSMMVLSAAQVLHTSPLVCLPAHWRGRGGCKASSAGLHLELVGK
jgi:hypothetical protein